MRFVEGLLLGTFVGAGVMFVVLFAFLAITVGPYLVRTGVSANVIALLTLPVFWAIAASATIVTVVPLVTLRLKGCF